jgi:hypothetical protein
MARLSATSNPTGLLEIDRKRVSVRTVIRDGVRNCALVKLDVGDLKLDPSFPVILIARSGNTTERAELGTVGSWSKADQPLPGLDAANVQRYRVLIRDSSSPKIVASAENLRLANDSGSESLIPMLPADLGQELWQLTLDESDGATLLYNKNVFPSGSGAESNVAFVSLVLPEALRQVLLSIAGDPDVLSDEKSSYFEWGTWLDGLGASRPAVDLDDSERLTWANSVVAMFCEREKMADKLQAELTKGPSHD